MRKISYSLALILLIMAISLTSCVPVEAALEEDVMNAMVGVFCFGEENDITSPENLVPEKMEKFNEQAYEIYALHGFETKREFKAFQLTLENILDGEESITIFRGKIEEQNCASQEAIDDYFRPLDPLTEEEQALIDSFIK